jgi:hypothetical protein
MDNLLNLKGNFDEIKEIRFNIKNIFNNLSIKIKDLKNLYVTFINRNTKTNFLLGLDSFHFQNKLIDIEFECMKKMFLLVNNRMYCEYYKLHKVILAYIIKNISDKKVIESCKSKREYPVYKDLEPYKEYDFDLINDLHHDILQIISELQGYLLIKERELKNDEQKSFSGLNIDNFINTSRYNNALLKEQISLFIEYLKVFHKYHNKYLTRFNLKVKLMYGQIQADIKLEESRMPKYNDTDSYTNTLKDVTDIQNLSRYKINTGNINNEKIPTTINGEEEKEIKDFIHTEEDSPNMKNELNNILTSISSTSSQGSSNIVDDILTPRSNLSDIQDLCNNELTAEEKKKLKRKNKKQRQKEKKKGKKKA